MKTSMSMLRVVCCWCLCLSLCTMGLAKETITQSGVVKPATQEQLTQEKNKDRVAAKLNAAGPAEVKVKPNPKTLLEVKLAEPTRSSVQEPKAIVKSMPKALGKKMPKTIVTSVDRGQKVKEAAVLNSKLQLRETAVVNSKVGYDEKLQFKNKLQLSDKLHLSKKVALGNKIELRDAGEKINSAGAYRY